MTAGLAWNEWDLHLSDGGKDLIHPGVSEEA
jgi:hypothetical protein